MKKIVKLAAAISVFCITLLPLTAIASVMYSDIYAFGDSLSDVGNDFIITNSTVPNPSIYTDGTYVGRFTNGPNYLDVLSGSLGLTLQPSLAGGTDYAYGGARTNYIHPGLASLGGLSFNQQIAAYDSTHAVADSSALYVLWIGANDLADAIAATVQGDSTAISQAIGTAMAGISNAIANLAGRGAQHFLVPNLPDLALVPQIGGLGSTGLNFLANLASTSFNTALDTTLDQSIFSALDIRNMDVFGLLNNIVANPGAYGLIDVEHACYTGEVDGSSLPGGPNPPTICADPSQYAFWDYEHPSATVHAELAALAFAAVIPEPSTLALLVLGLSGVGFSLRKRA